MPSSNPLWFGYYPGDRPVYKKPTPIPPPTPINAPDFGINEAFDEALNFAGKPAEMPNQIWEWVKEDLKQQFTVGASPSSTLSGSELYQFDRGETADVTGIYSSINLVDLVRDPKTTFTKFAENSFNAINPLAVLINGRSEFWTDLDTASQRAVWDKLIKTSGSSGKTWGFGLLKDTGSPIDLVDQGVYTKGKIFSTSTGKLVDVTQTTDVYRQVAENTLGFIGSKKSALFRNIAYRGFEGSVITAASTELTLREKEIEKVLSTNPILNAELGGKIQAFTTEGAMTVDVNELGVGLKKLREAVTQRSFTNQVTMADLRANLEKLDTATDNIYKQLEEIRKLYKLRGVGASAELQTFNKGVSELERFAGDIKGFTGLYKGRPDTDVLGRVFSADSMVSQATQLQSRFANARYGGGVQDRYLESISRRYLEGPKSLLNLKFADPADPTKSLFTKGYESLNPVYSYHRAHYLQEAGRDLADAFLKDKLSGSYLWFGAVGEVSILGKRVQVGLIKDRIQQFTPGYWTGQLVARTHKFGLVYDEDYEDKVLHPIFNKNPLIQKHTFTEKVDYTVGGKIFSVTGRFSGSKELGSFYRAWDAGGRGKLVGSVLGDGSKDWITNSKLNRTARFNLLNGKSKDIGALSGGKEYLLDFERDWSKIPAKVAGKDWKNLTDKAKEMREQLARELKLTTISGGLIEETDENFAKLDAFFKKVGQRKGNPAFLDPFQEKFGALQIYASKLSQIQQEIIKRLGLSKVIESFVNFRRLLSQKVMGLVSKVLAKLGVGALVAATGGLATVLLPIIEKVLQIVIAKTIDKAKALLLSILKGNFEQELSKMMDDSMKAMEKVITCGCIVPIITSFAILLLMGTVITSISPVDRSKAPSSSASTGGSTPPVIPPPITGQVTCPIQSPHFALKSFRTVGVNTGHGSKYYWTQIFNVSCPPTTPKIFSIPFLGTSGAGSFTCDKTSGFNCSPVDSNPDVYCPGSPTSTPSYGFAADVAGDTAVNVPTKVCATDVNSWTITGAVLTGTGCGVVIRSDNGVRMFLLHVATCPGGGCSCEVYKTNKVLQAGAGLTSLYDQGGNTHLHIEIMQGSSYRKPEDCVCN